VNTAFRRKGIGQSLINIVINDAKLRKSEDIILEVRASNHEAQALYHKLKFESIGIRRGYYESENGREDAYVLKLSL
jgi:ribosomal-protein-alanine N-acetyltransferase